MMNMHQLFDITKLVYALAVQCLQSRFKCIGWIQHKHKIENCVLTSTGSPKPVKTPALQTVLAISQVNQKHIRMYICIRIINKRISMLYPGWIKRCALPSSPWCRDGCRDRSRCYRCHLDLRSACGASHPWPWNRSEAQDFIFFSPSGNHSEACSFTCHASAISDCYPALLEGSRTDKYVSVTSWGGSAHSMLKAIFGAICSCPSASADRHVGASTY